MVGTIYSIIPAILMLVLVLLTRRVLLSLGAGIIVGALFIHDFAIWPSIKEIWSVFYEIFISDGSLNVGNLLLLGFLLLLGSMTAFLQASGGSKAFGDWIIQRVKTRRGAQLSTAALGVMIFIDDYFNSLAVGQIARPMTDRHHISRAKLAYYIDSTSAPVTVMSPISSWGAYIIGILASLFATHQFYEFQPLEAFVKMIPLNLYALAALLLVFLVAYFNVDIGPMKVHERRAVKDKDPVGPNNQKIPGDLSDMFSPHEHGKVYHLVIPIVVLIVVTISMMVVTGIWETTGEVTIFSIFANTNVNLSLFTGGILAVLISFIFHLQQKRPRAKTWRIFVEGFKTMLPAIYILLLAWMIGSIIGTLKTGEYLAALVESSNISPAFLPLLFFLIASLMSLATGTSWGTFGIMLPIAIETALVSDVNLLLPTLAAVLAGSVFGDHCTPISDTTILSSTGAGVNHIDHVMTQLPYAITAAIAAGLGYTVIGFTEQFILGVVLTLFLIILFTVFIKIRMKRTQQS